MKSTIRTKELTTYLTPFATVLILCGLAAARPRMPIALLVLAFALAGVVFNWYTALLVEESPVKNARVAKIRPVVNYILNVFLVYLLYADLRDIWLLFTLAPIGVAVHGSQKETVLSAFGGCAALWAVHALRGQPGSSAALSVLINSLFILLLPLFIHALVHPESARRRR